MPTIIPITDFAAPELDIYARLTENQLLNRADPANALFVAESPLVIGRALDAGCTPVSFLMETKHVNGKGAEILARCPADIPVYAAELEVLTQLTGFHLTRGMLCAMRRPPLPTVEEICAKSRRIAVLENVMNPTNIGAIFRSAAALGMDAVLLTAAYEALSNRIEKLGLKDNVHLLGYVKNPYSILIQADVYVCSSRHESFSLTVAESLILGIPVISTRCTGPIELLENGKYGMLIGHESSDIQNAIEELIMDKEKLENYRKMVSLRKSFFEVEKNIKEWETVLDR